MIVEYFRPTTIQEALSLLAIENPPHIPIGGGTSIDTNSPEPLAVVDLQGLDLDDYRTPGSSLVIGATFSLQALSGKLSAPEMRSAGMAAVLKRAVELEATYNLRQVATVAGSLVAANGRSPFAVACLALDASLTLLAAGEELSNSSDLPPAETLSLGELLLLRPQALHKRLITGVTLPANVRLAYEVIARTPADQPIVCAAVAVWPSGRTRVVLGGFGSSPTLAFDGPEAGGAEIAAHNAYLQAGDEWASAEYRSEMAKTLTLRCLEELRTDTPG